MNDARTDTLFMRALRREPVERTPVWLMRQAGRYLPEYRELRKQYSFLDLIKTPELACEVTLQPIRRYGFDAAILFSDILILPHVMGLGLGFTPGEGPKFERPLREASAIADLPRPDPNDDTGEVMDAVRLIRRDLPEDVPLIGFAGSPWTVATYMIEGGSSKDFKRAKKMLLEHPQESDALIRHLADSTADYLIAQAEAGADALMVFDSWGGVLSPAMFERFSLAGMQRIVELMAIVCEFLDVFFQQKHFPAVEIFQVVLQQLGRQLVVKLAAGVVMPLEPFHDFTGHLAVLGQWRQRCVAAGQRRRRQRQQQAEQDNGGAGESGFQSMHRLLGC